MRHRSLGWIVMGAWLGALPAAAHADYLSSARTALKKGDLRTAQIELRNAVRNDPQNAEAHYMLARISLELGDPIAAEREAVAARDRGYDPRQATALLSQSMLVQNKFDDLLKTLKPDGKDPLLDASILVSRGYAQLGLRRLDDAKQSFADAEQAAPDAIEPLLADARLAAARGDMDDAQAKIDRALAAQPKSAEALLAKAQLLRHRNDIPGALAILDALINDQPGSVQARLDRANLQLTAGKPDAARTDVDMVRKVLPNSVQAIYLAAVIDAQAHDYQAANTELEKISPYVGNIPRAYYLLAVIKEQLGQHEQAEDAARKYLGRTPNDPTASKMLARIQFARHRPDQAIDMLAKIAQSGKADAEIYDLLGQAYAATGQSQDAIDALQQAQALAPDDVGVQTRLASARMNAGDADSAMNGLEHTLRLAPTQPSVGEALFFAALATGDLGKANEALTRIRAAQGDTEVVTNMEGLYRLAQIDLDGARTTFEELGRKHPDFVPGRVNLARIETMQGNPQAAERQLTDILARQPTAGPALALLVADYMHQKRMADAVAVLERAHNADPSSARITLSLGDTYIRAGTPQKALDLATAEKNTIEILGLRAAAYLALGRKPDARAVYEEILKQDPGRIAARRQLVALLVDAKEFETARNVLTAGIGLNPHEYQFYQDYVMVDLKASGLDSALATAGRLQSDAGDFPPARSLKGDLYLAAGRGPDAVTAFREALNEAPVTFLATRLADAMIRTGQAEQAKALLAGWLASHPEDLAIARQLSDICIARHQLDDAAKYLTLVLRQKPHDPITLNNLAWIEQQRGNAADAHNFARQAYVMAPGAQTADTLGWILTASGDTKTGIALLRQASEGASDPRILYHYAVALKQTGDTAEARRQLEAVVAFRADFQEKAEARKLLDDLAKGT